MVRPFRALAAVTLATLPACSGPPTSASGGAASAAVPAAAASAARGPRSIDPAAAPTPVARSLDGLNRVLAARGSSLRVARAEYITGAEGGTSFAASPNHVVFAADHQLRLDSRWVPGDPGRGGRTNLTYRVSRAFMGAPSPGGAIDGEPAIDASFATWEGLGCADLAIDKLEDLAGYASLILPGGSPPAADIEEVGFLPGAVFDYFLGPDASQGVIGVTFTFVWVDSETGEPTDIDHDHRLDTAYKEVWYDAAFAWATSGNPSDGVDIQSIALHENGHALDMGHMGLVHATFDQGKGVDRPGTLHLSPRAVMNAFYLVPLRSPLGTDRAAYCGNYGSWPQH